MATETLHDLLRELEEAHAVGYPDDEAACQALYKRHWDLRERIEGISARTISELKSKARAAELALERDPDRDCETPGSFLTLARSIHRDIDAIAEASGGKAEG